MSSYFGDSQDAWDWWESVDKFGKVILTPGSKFPRERWHLHWLHQASTLDAISHVLKARLRNTYKSKVHLRMGSVWIDQTPQARTKYWDASSKKAHQVSCELADLLVVTHINVLGASPALMDTRAVLVQAKVSNTPGILDSAPISSKTSSSKERNLLECVYEPIALYRGTKSTNSKQWLGTYDLGCSKSQLGLNSYARYLTIANALALPPTAPYQSMWPSSRSSNHGTANSFEDMLFSMMVNVAGVPAVGASLVKPPNSEWPRLVNDLTNTFYGSVVKRFLMTGAVNRIEQGALMCFQSQQSSVRDRLTFPYYLSMADEAAIGDLGHLNIEPPVSVPGQPERENGPAIPVLMVHAVVDGSSKD